MRRQGWFRVGRPRAAAQSLRLLPAVHRPPPALSRSPSPGGSRRPAPAPQAAARSSPLSNRRALAAPHGLSPQSRDPPWPTRRPGPYRNRLPLPPAPSQSQWRLSAACTAARQTAPPAGQSQPPKLRHAACRYSLLPQGRLRTLHSARPAGLSAVRDAPRSACVPQISSVCSSGQRKRMESAAQCSRCNQERAGWCSARLSWDNTQVPLRLLEKPLYHLHRFSRNRRPMSLQSRRDRPTADPPPQVAPMPGMFLPLMDARTAPHDAV